MERPLDSAQERQPLLELQRHEAETPAAAPQQPAAGALPESADAPAEPAPAQPPAPERLLSERRCRYCLQEEEPDNALEAPCKCAGSIKWAHHACVQRWVDEKHDKRCEICGSQFEGDYRQPPPPPASPAAVFRQPLVAQLQVTNDDTRVVSLADPVTGEVVARMVMGPASAELRDHAAAAGVLQPHAAAAAEAQGDGDEPGPSSCLLLVLYVLAWVGLLVTIPFSMAADAGDDIHQVRLLLIFVVLALRICVWPTLQQREEQQSQRQRQAAVQRARHLAADIEAGLAPQRPRPMR